MSNRRKIINQITRNYINYYKDILDIKFSKARKGIRKDTKDLDYSTLVIYKNLG